MISCFLICYHDKVAVEVSLAFIRDRGGVMRSGRLIVLML